MDNDSSEESNEELDVEQEPEEDHHDLDAEDDQNNPDSVEDEGPNESRERRPSHSRSKSGEPMTPTPRKETIAATVFDIVPTM